MVIYVKKGDRKYSEPEPEKEKKCSLRDSTSSKSEILPGLDIFLVNFIYHMSNHPRVRIPNVDPKVEHCYWWDNNEEEVLPAGGGTGSINL